MIDDFKPSKRSSAQPPLRSALNDIVDSSKQKIPEDSEEFRTPEEVAAEADLPPQSSEPSTETPQPDNDTPPTDKPSWRERLFGWWPPKSKKEWAVLGSVVVVVVAAGVLAFLHLHSSKPAVATKVVKAAPARVVAPTTVPSTLTGLPVAPDVNKRVVTGVMIENSEAARPQSGLSQAGVVFEAIAEGGITRFLALFQDTAPTNVGPIRSARPYYAQWALGFDAGYAHVGGSPEALSNIKQWGVRDLDQFANGAAYHRVSSREAPHNVYTGIDTLHQLETNKGYNSSKYTGFARNLKSTPAKTPTVKNIGINISGPIYNVQYTYNATTNSYDRSEGGAPHMDAEGNVRISPKVVVVLAMDYSLEADGYHSSYQTIGSGPATIFQDGTSITGQWKKDANASQFSFTDSAGKPIKLDPGQTWLTAVTGLDKVTATP